MKLQICRSTGNWPRLGLVVIFIPAEWQGNTVIPSHFLYRYGMAVLSFYGPNYAVSLNGTVTTTGSMVAKSFSVNGGGNGGFHYDEALGKGGDIAGWTIATYFEDARAD